MSNLHLTLHLGHVLASISPSIAPPLRLAEDDGTSRRSGRLPSVWAARCRPPPPSPENRTYMLRQCPVRRPLRRVCACYSAESLCRRNDRTVGGGPFECRRLQVHPIVINMSGT